MLRVAFLNLQGGVGMTRGSSEYLTASWKYLLPHRALLVEPVGAWARAQPLDVFGCAETELPSWRGRGVDLTEALAVSTGLPHHATFPTWRFGRLVHQGNALVSRHPIVSQANHRLPGAGQARFVGEVVLDVEGERWTVWVTHLSLNAATRAEQIAALAGRASSQQGRAVLMGDFNTTSLEELRPLEEAGLVRADTGPSQPSWRPRARVDHLFASSDARWRDARTETALRVSDHLPVLGRLERPAEAG